MTYWYIIDEDTNEIVATVYGTQKAAMEELDRMKDSREPGDENYWHVLTLFGRAS